MAIDLPFRRRAVRSLTNDLGCYGLCSLNQGVWLSLSTAQSLQMDVWETAWVSAVR
jgi:hypothetical protein